MKKMLKIALPLLTIVMFFGTTMVRADFAVTIGASNDYDVVTSDWTVAAGSNSGSGTGVNIYGVGYAEGEVLNVEVILEDTYQVAYNLTVDTDTYSYVSSDFGNILFFAFSLLLPLIMPMMVGGTWDQAAVDMGPSLWGEFFLDSIMTEAMYEIANNQTALDVMINDEDFSEITFKKFEGVFENSTDIAVFDWACDFDMVNSTTSTDYGGKYRWKIAFDQTTSWVKGWRLYLDYKGTYEGQLIEVEWDQLVQQQGYTLGKFAIKTGLFPGFEWFLIFPALGLLALPVIIKRRK